MNTWKKHATGATVCLALAAGVTGLAATTASAATTSTTTTSSSHVLKSDRASAPGKVTSRTPHTKSDAVKELKQAAEPATQNPVVALLKAVAVAMILLVKLFTPAAVYAAMVAAVKASVKAFQAWINTMPSWLRSLLSGLSLGGLWRALKSLVGLL